jgi:hypothetical protein
MREEFEKAFPVPENCDWWSVLEAYSTKNRSTVHPYNDKWQAWQAATALQAERVRELEEALRGMVHHFWVAGSEDEWDAIKKAKQALSATARVSA